MKNKKGFTLIELLAVIVILAIIALIATPIVLNMIRNARKSAARSSALGYVSSIEKFISMSDSAEDLELNDTSYKNVVIPKNEKCNKVNGTWKNCSEFFKKVDIKTKGGKPSSANIEILSTGLVKENSWFIFNNYKCTYINNDVTCDLIDESGSKSVAHYDIVPPTETSPTDYKNLGYNVFLKNENNIVQVCVNKESNISCFDYNNAEKEYEHAKQVFGSENCSGDFCQIEELQCRFKSSGTVRCDDRILNFSCMILNDGDAECN